MEEFYSENEINDFAKKKNRIPPKLLRNKISSNQKNKNTLNSPAHQTNHLMIHSLSLRNNKFNDLSINEENIDSEEEPSRLSQLTRMYHCSPKIPKVRGSTLVSSNEGNFE